MNKKQKLMTNVEKTVHRYIETIKEMSEDSTILFMQRNNIPVDRDSMTKTIEVFKMSLDSQQMQLLDRFVRDLEKVVSEVISSEDE